MGELFLIILLVIHLVLAIVMSAKLIKQSKIKRDIRLLLFVALWLIPLIGAAFVSDLLKIQKANKKIEGSRLIAPAVIHQIVVTLMEVVINMAYNKQIMALATARWDANMWAAHFVRIIAHMPAPLI